jgi:thiamine biosynthesis lipoprotein
MVDLCPKLLSHFPTRRPLPHPPRRASRRGRAERGYLTGNPQGFRGRRPYDIVSMDAHRPLNQEAIAAHEAPTPVQLPPVPGQGQYPSPPSHPYRGAGRHRRHGGDRHRRGQGAPGGEFGAQRACSHDHADVDVITLVVFLEHGRREQCRYVNHADHQRPHDHHDAARRHFGRDQALSANVISPPTSLEARHFRAIGTTATVIVLDPHQADRAEAMLRREIDAIDRACSRFRPDSELAYLHRHAGRPVVVSPLLFEALEVAVAVAERTHGAVDPTIGNAMDRLGYDCDFDQIESQPPLPPGDLGPVVGFGHIHCEARTTSVRIPRGVHLDLGSSAKAFVVDRSAARIADHLETGVLVSVGGDVAVAGPPPPGGWAIGIAVNSAVPAREVDQVVAIRQGGLASSSTAVRTWRVGPDAVHHILDPSTGYSSEPYWTLASVAGTSCVDANALSTAAIVWGRAALEHLRPFGRAVRLVGRDGKVVTFGGWPDGEAS